MVKREGAAGHYPCVATDLDRTRTAADPLGLTLGRYLLTGDEGAIEEIVRAMQPRLLAAARRIAGPDDAEDAVQTAYLSLVRRRGSLLDAPVLPWLLTAVVRTAYRRRAAARRLDVLADRLAMVPDDAVAPEADDADRRRLRAAVHRLPARYRDPVVLHDLHGLSTLEVARLLGLTEGGVRTRLHRARALVKARLLARAASYLVALPWAIADRAREGSLALAVGVGGAVKLAPLALVAVVALAAGAFVGRHFVAPPVTADERATKADQRIAELETQLRQVERERDEAVAKARRTLAVPDRPMPSPRPPATAGGGDKPAPATTPDPAAEATRVRVAVAGADTLLAGLDWTSVGANVQTMVPMLLPFGEQWAKTGEVPMELALKINTANAPLVQVAVTLAKRLGLQLREANQAFTHPAVVANVIAATLEASGKPASPAQAEELARLAAAATTEETNRRAAYPPTTFELRKLVEDAEARRRYYDAAFAVLSVEQRDVLVPPAAKGRLQIDLFSEGLVWAARAEVVKFATREELEKRATQGLRDRLGWTEAREPALASAVAAWVAALPREVVDEPGDPLSQLGMLPSATVLTVAKAELDALERLGDSLRGDDAAVDALRQVSGAFIPVRAPAK